MPRHLKGWGLRALVLVIAVVLAGGSWVAYRHFTKLDSGYERIGVTIDGEQRLQVEVADTPEKQRLGLGGRESLENGQGMLFPYDEPGTLCFWMKGMKFPIDMVWLDEDRNVVRITAAISPATYPENFCAPADRPASYVIEVASGQARQLGLREGARVSF